MSWLTGWTYRKRVSYQRPSGTVTNYQVKLLIAEGYAAAGASDASMDGFGLSSFNDLRFTTSDGQTLLDYWIESISGTTPSQIATVWVEFDSIGTGATDFYMYYGNSGASAVSSGANTFIFFDDFNRADNADVGGGWTEQDNFFSIDTNRLKTAQDANAAERLMYKAHSTFAGQIMVEARMKLATASGSLNSCLQVRPNISPAKYASLQLTGTAVGYWDSTWKTIAGITVASDTYYTLGIMVDSDAPNVDFWVDRVEKVSNITPQTGGAAQNRIEFQTYGANSVGYTDWVLSRKFLTVEPSLVSWGPAETESAGSWLTGWRFRKKVTLSRASGTVTNYQMKVIVGQSAGAAAWNVNCEGITQFDFADLRFTKSDGSTQLDYWVESVSGTYPNLAATVWVEFDSIGTGATTFFMYYGRTLAGPGSNGKGTFPLFDDFLGAALDPALWTTSGSPTITVASGAVTVASSASADRALIGLVDYGTGYAMRSRCKSLHNDASYDECFGLRRDSPTIAWSWAQLSHSANLEKYRNRDTAAGTSYANMAAWTANTYAVLELWRDAATAVWSVDDAGVVYLSTNYDTGSMHPYAYVYTLNASITIDWVLIRQKAAVEPVWGPWGKQEYYTTAGWLTGWGYRKAVGVALAGAPLTNYQVKVLIGESAGATGEAVDCGGLCKTDFTDIRFTADDGTTLLDYWFESVSGTSPNQLAIFWVEVPTSPAQIFMYFGNTAASTASDGANTFAFFDNFDDASLDTNKWTNIAGAGVTEAGGELAVAATSDTIVGILGKTNFSVNYALRSRVKSAHLGGTSFAERIGFKHPTLDDQVNNYFCHTNASYTQKHANYLNAGTGTTAALDGAVAATYCVIDILRNALANAIYRVNDGNEDTISGNLYTGDMTPCISTYKNGGSITADWILVRKYTFYEPACVFSSMERADIGWLGTWAYRLPFVIDRSKVTSPLYDFPVLLRLSSRAGVNDRDITAVFTELGASSLKIAVTRGDGTTECKVEVVTWDNANGLAHLWVKVPKVSDVENTLLFLYFDSAQSDNTTNVGATGSAAGQAVWDSNFKAVLHLQETPPGTTGTFLDATANAHNGTSEGTMTSGDSVLGLVGKGIDFDVTDDRIALANHADFNITGAITVEAIIRTGQSDANERLLVAKGGGDNAAEEHYALSLLSGTIRFTISNSSTRYTAATTSPVYNDYFFHCLAGRYIPSTAVDVFVDGVKTTYTTSIPAAMANTGTGLGIGNGTDSPLNSGRYAASNLGEIRLSNVARSDAWIALTHLACRDNLIYFGAVQRMTASGLSGWAAWFTITIDSSMADDNLPDFPLAIRLSTAAGTGARDLTALFTALGANSLKIAVTLEDGQMQLPVEVALWDNANNLATLHARVPILFGWFNGNDQKLRLYFDASKDDNTTYVGARGSTVGKSVWDKWFRAVYHLNETPAGAGTIYDSTEFAVHGSPQATPVLASARFDKGLDFERGDSDYVTLPSTEVWVDKATGKTVTPTNCVLTILNPATNTQWTGPKGFTNMGTTGKLSIPDSDDFNFTGSFCTEAWWYYTGLPGSGAWTALWGQMTDSSNRWYVAMWNDAGTTKIMVDVYNADSVTPKVRMATAWLPVVNQWYHIAVSREGNNVWRIFVNGYQINTVTDTDQIPNLTGAFEIGYHNTAYSNAYFSDFRISKGVPRYTANFIPPRAHTVDQYTVLLIDSNPRTASYKRAFNMTEEVLFNLESFLAASVQYPLIYEATGSTNYARLALWVNSPGQDLNRLLADYRDSGSGTPFQVTDSLYLAISQWYHAAITINTGTDMMRLLRDGISVGTPNTTAKANATIDNPADAIGVGKFTGSSPTPQYHDGLIDEIRLHDIDRSDAWIRATSKCLYDMMASFGAQENASISVPLGYAALKVQALDPSVSFGLFAALGYAGLKIMALSPTILLRFITAGMMSTPRVSATKPRGAALGTAPKASSVSGLKPRITGSATAPAGSVSATKPRGD